MAAVSIFEALLFAELLGVGVTVPVHSFVISALCLFRFLRVASVTDRACPVFIQKRNIRTACLLHFTRHLINHILERRGKQKFKIIWLPRAF
jgi:hypothetical protein